jgi:hypothetical protein
MLKFKILHGKKRQKHMHTNIGREEERKEERKEGRKRIEKKDKEK